ncbi:helix-turn-helix domain-containing protein [Nocardiopsis algeriensis]|uniref:helix-turn-helix domain-containing protein n=1 Tax=Nocardiopsis algeriensis TaxID=1478215 RepID=UPI003B434711
MPDEPSLRQRWLGTRLEALRREAGFSLQEASRAAQRSTASLSRIENGVVALPARDVRPLLDAYRVENRDTRETLIAVAGEVEAERRGWWVEHSDTLSPSYLDLLRLEATASEVRTYETSVIPGLLQHKDYARRAVALTSSTELSEDALERFIAVRRQRQQILHRDEEPTALHAVIHEAALHQTLGAPEVLAEQLVLLRELMSRPLITVQVLPLSAPHPALAGAFTLVETHRLTWVHVELQTSDVYLEAPQSVAPYLGCFKVLSERALPPAESVKAINARLDALTSAGSTAE